MDRWMTFMISLWEYLLNALFNGLKKEYFDWYITFFQQQSFTMTVRANPTQANPDPTPSQHKKCNKNAPSVWENQDSETPSFSPWQKMNLGKLGANSKAWMIKAFWSYSLTKTHHLEEFRTGGQSSRWNLPRYLSNIYIYSIYNMHIIIYYIIII